jgi:uncharacterized membrane protein YeaQ/YmgE (transglycosylase-associated protein family)
VITNIIVWILFGALVGWIASLIMSTNHEQGAMQNIIIGIGGALVGGFLAQLLGFGGIDGFDMTSLLLAITGSIIIIAVLKAVRHQSE